MAGTPTRPGKSECINAMTLANPNNTQSLTTWVGEWRAKLKTKPDKALVAAAQDVLLIAAEEASTVLKKGEEFHIRPELAPVLDHLLWAIAMVAKGERFHDIEVATGISWTRLHAASGVDRRGFGVVWDVAMRIREEGHAERAQELLRLKAEKGVTKPVVVRKGRDNDEIEMVTQDSESLIAKAAEFGARMRQEKSEAKNTVNIGQAVTYNIEAPQFILKNEPLKLIETNPLEGLKKKLE